MKQPKFKFGDKVISDGGAIFEVASIRLGNFGDYYYRYKDHHLDISECKLSLYIEPKPKVKMWLYVIGASKGENVSVTSWFYKGDQSFKEINPSVSDFKKLEWSMIEVECD